MAENSSVLRLVGSRIDSKVALGIIGAAILWFLSGYFVPQTKYEEDRMEMKSDIREIKSDIKTMLINQGERKKP